MNGVDGPNFAAYIFAAAMLLIAVVTQLAASGRIGRNGFVGIRIPPTLASEAAWRAGHRAAVLPTWIGFVVVIITAVVAQFAPQAFVVVVVLLLLFLVWAVLAAWLAARSATQ
ncbi:MAG: SdpI family protein [Actinomycetota bacterium]